MKILHLNDHLAAVGGVETYLLGLVPRLSAAGHVVHLAFAHGDAETLPHSHHLPLLDSIRHRDIATGERNMQRLLDRLQPDVIHLHGIQNLGVLRAAASSGRAILHGHDFRPICPAANFYFKRSGTICERKAGAACYAVTLGRHCMTPRPLPALYFLNRVRWIQEHADSFRHVIAPSEAARDRFLKAGFRAEHVTTNPYFCPMAVRTSTRPPPAHNTVTFLGRASYNKGWETFIAALGRLAPEVQGLMVGGFNDVQRQTILQLARKAGCEQRLQVEGWAGRDAIASVMARTTLLTFPSLWPETLGIVGLEALSQGVPVVASDVGGVREWLHAGVTGELVPPGDATSLAAALGTLLADPARMQGMGEQGMALMRSKFSAERHLETLLHVYRQVAK